MKDPFKSPLRKIARANHHISDLDEAIGAFNKSEPYASVVEPHDNGTHDILKIVLAKPIPEEIEEIIADAGNCLRSALDQTGHAIAVMNGVENPRSAYFPFAQTAPELENTIKGRCKDIPPDIISLMRDFKPYKRGNGLLWAVNEIAKADKHRRLITVGSHMQSMHGRRLKVSGNVAMPPRWDPVKNELVFAIADRSKPVEADLNFSFYISFYEVETIAGHPVIPALRQMSADVENIVISLRDAAVE